MVLISDIIVGGTAEIEGEVCCSSRWAIDEEFQNLLQQNTYLSSEMPNLDLNQIVCRKEAVLAMKKKGDRSFHRGELIFELRKHQSLASLYYSLVNL